MKKLRIRSIICIILSVAVLAGSLPMPAFAAGMILEREANTDFERSDETNEPEIHDEEENVVLRAPEPGEEPCEPEIDGEEVSHDAVSRTYLMEDGSYLTRIYDEPIMYTDQEGRSVDIDNTLVSRGENFVNAENSYDLTLPKNGEGISIKNKGCTLTLEPCFGKLENAVACENSIRYNSVSDGIDLQYTAKGNSVKEDIIINKPVEEQTFKYRIKCGDLDVTVKDNILYAYKKGDDDPVFKIAAPYMSDNSGEVSQHVQISLDEIDGAKVLVTAPDWEWINDESRAYPVIIDPVIELNVSNFQWYLLENGSGTSEYPAGPDVEHAENPYLYCGFENGDLTGIPGLFYGMTRSFIKINYDFTGIPDNTIISAKLKAYKYTGDPAAGSKVHCGYVTTDWKGSTHCWNTKPDGSVIIDSADVSGGPHWVEWDISSAIAEWKKGKPNYGLMLTPEDENQAAVCFSGPDNPHGGNQMYFDISWTVPDAVDEDLPLGTPNINLRPLTNTKSTGLQQLTGVFADGVVRPTLRVDYRLNDIDSGVYDSAEYGRVYPESAGFEGTIPFVLGYTALHESNWQSKLFKEFDNNEIYNVYAIATDGTDSTPEGKSDSFIVYEFSDQDTLPYIADFYGVSLEQIIKDNRPQDYLGFSGNTFFIRNPKKNATVAYSRHDDLTDGHKRAIIYANLGRGMHSEFDLEPINVNIGNYCFSSTDASSSEYGGMFVFSRTYNSIGTKSYGVFGRGWSFGYAEKLTGVLGSGIAYTAGDGRQIIFENDGEGYSSPEGSHLKLEKHTGNEISDTYYTITSADGEIRTFDCYGLLKSVSDRNGFTTKVIYDGNYRIKEIVTSSGRHYGIETNADGQITSVTLPNGGKLRYEYKNGDLVAFTNADGDKATYSYDASGRMTEWKNANGNTVVKNVYDDSGRIVSQTDAAGNTSTLSYFNGITVVTDAGGRKTTYHYDSSYRTTKVEGAAAEKDASYTSSGELGEYTENGSAIKYEYDANGNVTKKTRADGTYQQIVSDEHGNAISVRDYDGTVTTNTYDERGNLLTTTKPDGSVISYTYDEHGQVTSITDGNGAVTRFEYDGLDKMTVTDANGNVSYCYYDAMGRLVSEIDPCGNETKTIYSKQGKKLGVWKTGDIYEQYVYDGNGNCIKCVDSEGNECVFTYDKLDRMLSAANPLGGVISYAYDASGNRISETDTLGNKTVYSYDLKNRLTESVNAEGHKTVYTYTPEGRIDTIALPDGSSVIYEYDPILGLPAKVTDKTGTINYEYDSMGRTIRETYQDGSFTETEYDPVGNIASFTDKNGLQTVYTYDAEGNVLTSSDSVGGTSEYTYDAAGNLLRSKDAIGRVTKYSYDAAGRLSTMTDAAGGTYEYSYDTCGNLISVKDPTGVSVSAEYDKNGRMTSRTDGNGNKTNYRYDGAGDLIASEDPLGGTVTYTYDTAQRLISQTDETAKTAGYEYDSLGRLVKTKDRDGYETQIRYDDAGSVTGITAPNGSETSYTYDSRGYLVKVKTADGLVTEYERDALGRVTKEWDNAGNITINTYDASGSLLTREDAAGRVAEYTYDLYCNVTEIKDFNGDVTKYEYDLASRMISETGPDGRKTVYAYDDNDNVVSATDADGVSYKNLYDPLSRLTETTDPLGQKTSFKYDNVGNLISVTDSEGSQVKYTYSATGSLISVTDGNGNTTGYEFDPAGRVIKKTTAEGSVTEYMYDGRGNVIKEKDPLGYVTENVYDSMGNLIKITSPRGAETEYEYNAAGLTLSEKNALGGVTSYEYAPDGKLTSKTLPNGLKYTYSYDVLGRIVSVSDSTGLGSELEYDTRGNVSQEKDQDGRITKYGYDALGRLISLTAPDGNETTYGYDGRGNLISVKTPYGAEIKYSYDLLGRVETCSKPLTAPVSYTYDAAGNIKTATQKDKITSRVYDAAGNVISGTDPLGRVSTFTYDKDDRLTVSIAPGGGISRMEYDAAGNITAVTDPLGGRTSLQYDADGNVTEKTDALGNVTKYRYDLAGDLIYVNTARGSITEYTYDSMGNVLSRKASDGTETHYSYDLHSNLTSITSPDGSIEKFVYDVSSRLIESVKPDGSKIKYNYDSIDNLLSKDYSDGTKDVTYGYDEGGSRVSMDDQNGSTTYVRDVLGRVSEVTDSEGRKVGYSYDEYGRISRISYPDGRHVSYTYDLNDEPVKVEDSAGETTRYTYGANGRVLTCERSSGISTKYSYDSAGHVISLVNAKGPMVLSSFEYEYDMNGQIVSEKATQDGIVSLKTFTYDADGQLSGYTEDIDGKESETKYSYSSSGSRLAVTKGEGAETTVSEYDKNGRLVKESGTSGTVRYRYDVNGNLTEKDDGSTKTVYSYDIENRLKAVREGGTLLMAASYDGEGNKVFQITLNEGIFTEDGGYISTGEDKDASVSSSSGSGGHSIPVPHGEKIYQDPADTIFWYGFGQGVLQFFTNANAALSAYLSDWFHHVWDMVTGRFDVRFTGGIAYSDGDIKAVRGTGISEDDVRTVLIPAGPVDVTRTYYDLTYYVNDVNTSNTQVLMTYGRNDSEKAAYVYGNGRISESDLISGQTGDYVYDGRGSVVQTVTDGVTDLSITYDPFGQIKSGVDKYFVGFAFNGEETNELTGLQFLRARYYDSSTGSFISRDSYLGTVSDVLSQNRYTYANNDPVNNIDPSGHMSSNYAGAMQYAQSYGLNEMRNYMVGAAFYSGQINAMNGFNGQVARAANTSMFDYQSITGISQTTANAYITEGISHAAQVSVNYGCSVPSVPDQAVSKFNYNVNAARALANEQIGQIKNYKKTQYDEYRAYQEYLRQQRELELARRNAERNARWKNERRNKPSKFATLPEEEGKRIDKINSILIDRDNFNDIVESISRGFLWSSSSQIIDLIGQAANTDAAGKFAYSLTKTFDPLIDIWKKLTKEDNPVAEFIINVGIGAYKENKIYHINQNYWQSYGPIGYNEGYDNIFQNAVEGTGNTVDRKISEEFVVDGETYIIWAWKGDYMNLGAGAETGIYKKFSDTHYLSAKDKATKMTLTLTRNGKELFTYDPYGDSNRWSNGAQWWINGFDYNTQDVDYWELKSTTVIDFKYMDNGRKMYEAFKKATILSTDDNKSDGWSFDDKNYIATLNW